MTTTTTSAPTTALTGERADLLESLRKHRFFLTLPARGLTDEQARLRPTASELCIGGIVKHVTQAERNWVRFVLEGPDAVPDHTSQDVYDEWLDGHTMRDDETLAGLLEAYETRRVAPTTRRDVPTSTPPSPCRPRRGSSPAHAGRHAA